MDPDGIRLEKYGASFCYSQSPWAIPGYIREFVSLKLDPNVQMLDFPAVTLLTASIMNAMRKQMKHT